MYRTELYACWKYTLDECLRVQQITYNNIKQDKKNFTTSLTLSSPPWKFE